MDATNSTPFLLGWLSTVLLGMFSLLLWKRRRAVVERRIRRGLRSYTAGHQVIS